tara:strand:- start:71 stop:274 length:204 start_codon:yes stop_codon:yes gene_type:complete
VVSRFLIPFNVFYFSVGQFNSLFSISFERWQKTALLVFQRWLSCRQKTKCAVCAAGFFRYETQRVCA